MNETNNLHYLNFPTLEEVEKVAESCKTLQISPISEISFFYIDKDTIANRVLLRKLLNTNENDHFVLVSNNKEVSFLAWKAAVFAFLHYKNVQNQQTRPEIPIRKRLVSALRYH